MDGLSLITRHELRPATGADELFLRRVLMGTMTDELALVPAHEAATLVTRRRLQESWRLHQRHYGHESLVILDEEGIRSGHLVVEQGADALHLLWLALLPEARGRGLASSVLLSVQDRASAAGLPAVAHGAPQGAAAALLVQHGFWVDPTIQARPVWRPAATAA